MGEEGARARERGMGEFVFFCWMHVCLFQFFFVLIVGLLVFVFLFVVCSGFIVCSFSAFFSKRCLLYFFLCLFQFVFFDFASDVLR